MTLRRLWKGQMEWSWMVEEFVWIILSPREHTRPHQAFTWADQLIVAVVDDEILTMIEDMTEAMTDTKIMITGTEEGRHLLITAATGHGQDLVPTAQDAIDNEAVMAKDFPFLF